MLNITVVQKEQLRRACFSRWEPGVNQNGGWRLWLDWHHCTRDKLITARTLTEVAAGCGGWLTPLHIDWPYICYPCYFILYSSPHSNSQTNRTISWTVVSPLIKLSLTVQSTTKILQTRKKLILTNFKMLQTENNLKQIIIGSSFQDIHYHLLFRV